ncbi:MAG: hypothetical protein ACYC6M_15695 [Terriglobales bacterium]
MATTDASKVSDEELIRIRDDWLGRLSDLVDAVKQWAEELGWSTRRIETQLRDSQIGSYPAPALLLQRETSKALLEPIARSAPGAEGVVDLYLMPAYDDIASLYFCDGAWQLHYTFAGTPPVATIRTADFQLLSKETLRNVLEEMTTNAAAHLHYSPVRRIRDGPAPVLGSRQK